MALKVEVAVTMMLKWLKSGIQDLGGGEGNVDETGNNPSVSLKLEEMSLKILTYIMEHWF